MAVYFIGVDVGTGSARACIIDSSGLLHAHASHDIQTWQSQTACYEQSTADIWQSICIAVNDAINATAIDRTKIVSIAFAATCSLAAFHRYSREPIGLDVVGHPSNSNRNVILWRHCAATKEAEQINETKHESLRYLGGSMSPAMALAKVLWLKNNMSNNIFEQCRFFDLHDALTDIATGGAQLLCEPACNHISEPAGFGVDGTIKGWVSDLFKTIGLPDFADDRNSRVGGYCSAKLIPIGTPVGTLCQQAAQDLGLSGSVLVSSGVIDCYAGWVGTIGTTLSRGEEMIDVPVSERIAIVAGTSACHVLASDQPHFVRGIWGPYKDFLLHGTFTMVGGQSAVGHLLQHVITTHPAIMETRSCAEAEKLSVFDYLDKRLEAMKISVNASNLTYLGRHLFIYGDHFGNRSPIADPRMVGSVTGLTGDVSIDNLAITYYVTLEFLALQTRQIIATLTNRGHHIGAIFMSGSLCLNRIFVEVLATACDLPVITPKSPQSVVSHGSALLAATAWNGAQGPQRDLWSIMKRMTEPGKLFEPLQDRQMRDLLEIKFKILLQQIEQQKMFRDMVDGVCGRH